MASEENGNKEKFFNHLLFMPTVKS